MDSLLIIRRTYEHVIYETKKRDMFNEIMIVGGLFWSAAYILIIKRGFNDKTFGMPLVALCANISWEAVFAFVTPHSPPQLYTNYAWFALDAIIVYQLLKYGKSEFPKFSIKQFYFVFVIAMATSIPMIIAINYEFNDEDGVYEAFGQNLLMSVLFITMLWGRNSLRGQSIYIALCKMFGTGIISIAFYLYRPIAQDSVLLPLLFIAIFIFDVIYVIMVYQKHKEVNIMPWKRL